MSRTEADREEWEARTALAAIERERIDDHNEEVRAIEMNPHATQTAKGKRIRMHGRKPEYASTEIDLAKHFGIPGMKEIIEVGAIIAAWPMMLQRAFGATSNVTAVEAIKFEDKDYIYDTASVSKPAEEILSEEAGWLNSYLADIEAENDPAERVKLAREMEDMANHFGMMLHPLAKRYVHDIERVQEVEHLNNPHGKIECNGTVCIFIPKAAQNDMRGIKSKVADQFDQDPREAQASGDHLKGQAPALHLN